MYTKFMLPKVSILLLNWNNWKETEECLESLKNIKYPNFNIILIDNGSVDDSLSIMKNFKTSNSQLEIVILENNENLGFGGGNNPGIHYALKNGSDYVLLLNNDTFVDRDFLDKLVEVADHNPKIGLTTPSIFFHDACPSVAFGRRRERELLWFGGKTYIQWRKMDKAVTIELFKKKIPQGSLPSKIKFATGACMLIKREVLEKVKGFYPPYFLYFEDVDLGFEIMRAGYELVWVQSSSIWHKVSATTLPKLGSASLQYYNTRNILLFAKRCGPFWVKIYMHFWAVYTYFKQQLKIIGGYNKELSLAIRQGIGDYYRGRFGKYQNFE